MAPLFPTIAALAVAVGSAFANNGLETDSLVASQILTTPYAHDFPQLGAPGASFFQMRHCHGFKLEEASIDEIQKQLEKGTFTTVGLLECYLDRMYQTQPYLKYVNCILLLESWLTKTLVLSCRSTQMHSQLP